MRNKPKFIFKSQAFDAGYKVGLKATKLEMAGHNHVMAAKERLKLFPEWLKVLITAYVETIASARISDEDLQVDLPKLLHDMAYKYELERA